MAEMVGKLNGSCRAGRSRPRLRPEGEWLQDRWGEFGRHGRGRGRLRCEERDRTDPRRKRSLFS